MRRGGDGLLLPGGIQYARDQGGSIALIVSEDIKLALERIRATGVRFIPV